MHVDDLLELARIPGEGTTVVATANQLRPPIRPAKFLRRFGGFAIPLKCVFVVEWCCLGFGLRGLVREGQQQRALVRDEGSHEAAYTPIGLGGCGG